MPLMRFLLMRLLTTHLADTVFLILLLRVTMGISMVLKLRVLPARVIHRKSMVIAYLEAPEFLAS